MRDKAKFLLIPLLLILVSLFSVNFVFAQTPPSPGPSVNSTEWQAIQKMVDDAQKDMRNGRFPAANAKFAQGKSMCQAFAPKLEAVSRGTETAFWVTPGFGVQFCSIQKKTTDNRQRLTTRETNLTSTLNTSTEPLTQEKFDAGAQNNFDTGEVDPVSKVIGYVLTSIFNVLTSVILAGTFLAGQILVWATGQTVAAITPSLVLSGWVIVRDIMNMFFILALIIISLATILRVEAYSYKKLLVKLVLMALLINFSKVIADALISISDLATQVFTANTDLKSYGVAFHGLVDQGNGFSGFFAGSGGGWMQALVEGVLRAVTAVIILISYFTVAILLFIRIVGLWVLIIISPVAYALNILPATEQYAKQWWSTFVKYLIWAPVAMFFMYLGQSLLALRGQNGTITNNTIFDAIFIGAFIWAGVLVAKAAGMAGASAVIGLAEKAAGKTVGAPLALGWAGAKGLRGLVARTYSGAVGRRIGEESQIGEKAAGRVRQAGLKMKAQEKKGTLTAEDRAKYEKQIAEGKAEQASAARRSAGFRAMSLLDPHVLKEAWKKRAHEKEMRAYTPAIGHMQDTFNRIVLTEWLKPSRLGQGELGKKTYHGLVGERAVVATEAKELLEGVRTREDAARVLRDAFKSGDKDEIMAALKVVQHGNWQDDYMNMEGLTFSPMRYLDQITKEMHNAGMSNEEVITILDDLKETGEGAKRIRAYGLTTNDPDGQVRAANDLSYYSSLSSKDQAKEFTKLSEKFKLAYEETNSDEFKVLSDSFGNASRRAASGDKFDAIIDENYAPGDDKTLRQAMSARRFMDEANVKLQRGEGHARAFEAAIFVDQTVDGWTDQNLLGKMLMHEVPPNVIASVTNRIHESQGRLLYGFGGFRDSQTGKWSLPSQKVIIDSRDAAAIEPDLDKKKILNERADFHQLAFKKIMETQRLAPGMFDAVTGSDRLFSKTQRDEFKQEWNAYRVANPGLNLKEITRENKEGGG